MSPPSKGAPVTPPVWLQASGLTLKHGPCEVVQAVDLRLRAGRWLSIVGPNGAGKSTLLHGLAGLKAAAAGTVMLAGRPLDAWAPRERARQLAWLGQGGETMAGLSVRDTVALGRLPHQGRLGLAGESADDAQAIDEALRRTDLLTAASRRIETLSGGERQRALLARALAVGATVLLLDEPSTHLDAPHLRLLAQVLRERASQGSAVVSVLHDLNLALAADEVLVLARGRVQALGPAGEATVHRALEAVFDQAIAVRELQGRWLATPQH